MSFLVIFTLGYVIGGATALVLLGLMIAGRDSRAGGRAVRLGYAIQEQTTPSPAASQLQELGVLDMDLDDDLEPDRLPLIAKGASHG